MSKIVLSSMITPDFIPGYVGFIKSLLKIHNDFPHDIVLLDMGLSEEQKDLCKSYYDKVYFIEPLYKNYKGVNFEATIPELQKTFYKLDVFSLGRFGYEQVVFIDLDTIILKSVALLFHPTHDFLAVKGYNSSSDKLRHNEFNSGVFVIGKKYLKEDVYKNLIEIIRPGFFLPDQVCLNTYFKDKVKFLPKDYNVEKRMYLSKRYPIFKNKNERIRVLHFVALKPWQLPVNNKQKIDRKDFKNLEKLWWEIMNRISIRRAKNAIEGLKDLCNYVHSRSNIKEMTMVEIGSFAGNSTEIFAQKFHKVYSVDPWVSGWDENDGSADPNKFDMKEVEKQFDIFILSQYNNVIKNKMKSEEASILFDDESLDFVYIDGDHRYEGVKKDIELWLPKIKKGGFIGGHDYNNPPHHGVKKAVDEFFKKQPDKTFQDTSWVIQKG